jgi:hypothetical protein
MNRTFSNHKRIDRVLLIAYSEIMAAMHYIERIAIHGDFKVYCHRYMPIQNYTIA